MNEYIAQPISPWILWVFGIGVISSGLFLLVFANYTMRRIEKQIKNDNISYHEPVDFGGSKVVTFAYAIIFPEHIAKRIERLIDVQTIRHHSNKLDWWLGLLFILTSHLSISFTIVAFIFS